MGHISSDENSDKNPMWESLHGQRDYKTAEAMADKNHFLLLRESFNEVHQRVSVMVDGGHFLQLCGIDAGASEVEGGGVVAGGVKEVEELEPAPAAMACPMNQNKVRIHPCFPELPDGFVVVLSLCFIY